MISESSPTLIYEAFLRPAMTQESVKRLIRNIWAAAYSKGFADSDRGHAILDEPEYRISEQLKFPVLITQTRETTRKNNMDNLELPELAKVVQLYRPKYGAGKRALK